MLIDWEKQSAATLAAAALAAASSALTALAITKTLTRD